MDEIILKLLKEHGRVILPDFGAIIVKQKNPFVFIFNEFLQYNDGALIGAIENSLNISKEEATSKTKAFIAEIIRMLDSAEPVNIPGVGILTKTPAGKITLSDVEAKSNTSESELNRTHEISTPVVEFDTSAEQSPKEENSPPDGQKVTGPETGPKDSPRESPQVTTAQTKAEEEKEPELKLKTSLESDLPPVNEYYNNQPEKIKKNFILWMVLILVVNGAIIGFFLYGDHIKGFFSKKNKAQDVTEITKNTSEAPKETVDTGLTDIQNETPVVEGQQEDTEDYQQSTSNLSSTKYYVVAGVFKSEANADKLVKDLRSKGFNAEKFGKIGSMFAVSYDVFPSKPEADKSLYKIKKELDPDAWIKIVD